MKLIEHIRAVVREVPSVKPLLSDASRFALYEPMEYKTYEYMLRQIVGLVNSLYAGIIGGDFIDVMANVISGQLSQAYQQAWIDDGHTGEALPEYLQTSLTEMVVGQYSFVDQYYRDIVNARIDNTPIAPLLSRAELWADRYNTAYQSAVTLIAKQNGAKSEWIEGDTNKKCDTCLALDGIVMYASEWEALGLHPKNPPNSKIDCGGWRCGCRLEPTDKRRSPNAYGRVEEILLAR